MKTVLLFLFLLVGIGAMQAQKLIQLGEAHVSYNPDAIVLDSDLSSINYIVKESYKGEFSRNPIEFMKQNFNFKEIISSVKDADEFDGFLVTFKSDKGYLEANYTNKGELKGTHQRFIDKILPLVVRNQLHLENKGWVMVGNKYIATGKRDQINKEIYRIKIANENKTRTVKIVPSTTLVRVASN